MATYKVAAGQEAGECGLTDGSSPGDWRLPTREERQATVVRAAVLGCTSRSAPSLTNTPGTACYSAGPQPFSAVQSDYYCSGTALEGFPDNAWFVVLLDGVVNVGDKTGTTHVWPVRGGQ